MLHNVRNAGHGPVWMLLVIMMDDDMQSDDGIGLGGLPKVYSALLMLARYYKCFENLRMAVVVVVVA